MDDIVKEINRIIVGWINYYKIGYMKSFVIELQGWLHHRLRQLIWKRWKKVSTRYRWLRKLGIGHDEALKSAASRKGYWRISRSEILHRALPNKKLAQWGLKDLVHLYER
ncbi:group II intron maturase-specific domain-containing protein [Trichococcus ilyis]|uniref:group II intron maturase-specific domain-containing protein n=1 Tax=Trichococcus ilyis TaxID=640938 RepID=UPI001EF6688A|nr:group II intron maturase-specific domain-containing protein [Trichococcus ilyis]